MAQGKKEQKPSPFIPALDTERRYKEQVNSLLESNSSKLKTIDMGRLPEIYIVLGIKDKELKTNGKTLLKALGIEGKNKHNVPIETIENLLSLTYDPEAVFKSLSTSLNPNAYVAVLNAKAFNQKQIIAILSPSRNGQGITFIPSVYERNKFNHFINKTYSKNRILYIKSKGSELWGQLQLLPRHNSEPYINNILTKNDVVKHFNENIFIKEKTMPYSEDDKFAMMNRIAENIQELSHHLKFHYDNIDACHYATFYQKSFGDEGVDYLRNKTDKLLKEYIFKKPDEKGIRNLRQFFNDIDKIVFHYRNPYGEYNKEDYNTLFESEKKEIAAFTNESSLHLDEKRNANKTSLEKINEHFEKNASIEPNGTVRVKGFAELSRELNKGKPYPGNALAFLAKHDRLPTDAELAAMPKQGDAETHGQTPPLERRNINSKENFMSDEFEEQGEQELSPKQKAFMEAAQHAGIQRKVIADAVKAGTLCCLPGTDGYADTKPAFNILNPDGKFYHGSNLLYLKEFQQKNGFPTGEYITYQQIENAKKDNPNLFIREGQKGISIHVNEKIGVNEWEEKHVRLFNVAQVSNPEKLKNWATQQLEEAEKKDLEWKKTHYGSGYEPPAPKQKEPGPEIVCSSTEPEKYLGQYLAAVSMGSKFKATPEQAAEFSEKMVDALYKKLEPTVDMKTGQIKEPPKNKQTGEPITDVFSFEKISANANKFCKEFMRDLKIEAQKQNQPEQQQKQEQTQSRGGRGM